MKAVIELAKPIRDAVWTHLLPRKQEVEQAAFLYATVFEGSFHVIQWEPVFTDDFVIQTSFHIELVDAVRARVIKRAHDLGGALIEMHSHLGKWPAQFSPSDIAGFDEWVPHVRWRLKGRPYAALVVTRRGFDGLAWIDSEGPVVTKLLIDGAVECPTGLSRKEKYEKPL